MLLQETRERNRIANTTVDRGIMDHTKRSYEISRAQAMVFRDTDVSRSDEPRSSRHLITADHTMDGEHQPHGYRL